MSRGQFFTVFTIGFSSAIAFLGVLAGITVLFWHRPVWIIAYELGAAGDRLSPFYLALILGGSSTLLAYWIFQGQQTITRWAADHAIRKLERQFREVEQALGTERANEFMRSKGAEMLAKLDDAPFGVFKRRAVVDAFAACGIHPDQKS